MKPKIMRCFWWCFCWGPFFSQYVRQELKAFIFHLLGVIFIITHPRIFVLAAKDI